ncbi:MAG: M28 family peptidase, partial [Gemmatimonadetes bacterium]|nr:M28 family peptidase [Gemmatimonadota bacterium]
WVEIVGSNGRMRAKPPSFSTTTGPRGLTAPLVYVPAKRVTGVGDLFDDTAARGTADLRGKIVISEGFPMPLAVARFQDAGAAGQIYVNEGRNIHWGICTPIWGMPTHANLQRKPTTPVVAVNRTDGEALVALAKDGSVEVTIYAALAEGWWPCKIPVARIRGETDEFLLVHGHYDSWDVGIGDNAVGDATLLELARIFHAGRDRLRRSLWVAWWPGHSMGRYAGSTWFADRFALELRKRCVAAVNIDSPGCWKATEYDDVMWMAEAEGLCREAIRDATAKEARGRRPVRAGDYSFDQIGLTSFFMLLSNIPEEERKRLGFYAVGGCGGNIAWHTEDDTLEVADRENLARDLRVYVTAISRVLNARILPFDLRATAREIQRAVAEYAEQAGELLDLTTVTDECVALLGVLEELYSQIPALERVHGAGAARGPSADDVNSVLLELSRILVPINYAEGERFDHDPALPRATVPKLAGVPRLREVRDTRPHELPFLQAGLIREANKVANALYEASYAVRRILSD